MSDQNLKDTENPSGPVKVGSYTITVDRDLCIGAATCIAVAPQTYILDSEAKAIILETADQEDDTIQLDAAKACPVAAIYIDDEQGNRVYPN
jgi:ferredoxin